MVMRRLVEDFKVEPLKPFRIGSLISKDGPPERRRNTKWWDPLDLWEPLWRGLMDLPETLKRPALGPLQVSPKDLIFVTVAIISSYYTFKGMLALADAYNKSVGRAALWYDVGRIVVKFFTTP